MLSCFRFGPIFEGLTTQREPFDGQTGHIPLPGPITFGDRNDLGNGLSVTVDVHHLTAFHPASK